MRTRITVMLGLIVAMLASGLVASSAVATPPVTMANGFVTDDAGVLTSSEIAAANERLSELAQANGGDLYFVFVDEFTDPGNSFEWADRTAIDNGLGSNQYLIAVAVESRQYALSYDEAGPLSSGQLDAVENAVENELGVNDWSGAIFAAAGAFPGQGAAGDSGGIVWVVVLLLVVAAIVVIVLVMRSRKKKQQSAQAQLPDPNDPYATVSDAELAQRAGTALVHADDMITSSRQELGFAVAQYGEGSATEFAQVVDAAQSKVAEAFSLKQQIDDDIPDTAEQQRAWHIQIIQLCAEADELIEDNVEAFEELRKIESEAPQALERIRARRQTAEQALATAPTTLATLANTYDTAALASVADNPAQAQQRLSLADTEIVSAQGLLAEGKTGEAAFAIRTAEEAVSQSESLVEAVTTLGANLASVEEQTRALIADLEADLAAAAAMPDAQGQLAPIVARTRASVDSAQADLQGTARNPQQALDRLDAANTEIDAALGRVREAAELAQRTQRMLEQRLTQAQAQISAANDFIVTRRGAIGATARTRLAEANAAYSEAVAAQAADPARAIERATRAYALAGEALSSARSEVDAFSTGGYYGGGYGGGNRGGDMGSAILGGIIGGMLSGGGGSRRSGWSSGGWGSGSSRRSRSSSFGSSRGGFGSSRGGSRGGGSRGGGRSRGGRF